MMQEKEQKTRVRKLFRLHLSSSILGHLLLRRLGREGEKTGRQDCGATVTDCSLLLFLKLGLFQNTIMRIQRAAMLLKQPLNLSRLLFLLHKHQQNKNKTKKRPGRESRKGFNRFCHCGKYFRRRLQSQRQRPCLARLCQYIDITEVWWFPVLLLASSSTRMFAQCHCDS